MKKMKKIIIAGFVALMASASMADLLTQFFSPNYVSGPVNGVGVSGGVVPFSMTTPRSPSANYTGPVYYGGAKASVAMSAGNWGVANSTPDYLNGSVTGHRCPA